MASKWKRSDDFKPKSSGIRKKPGAFKKLLRVLGKEMQMCLFTYS